MPDIFISYSRKDSPQALELAERLRTDGIDVWIDQHGIEVATSWSNEIVEALDESKAVLVLLSHASIKSDNVIRELSLAFEAKKTIVPVDMEPVTLPTQFRYHLAGIQRAQFSDFDGILRSLKKLGIEAKKKPKENTSDTTAWIRRLAVIPFEDLSPGKDHDWFSDGLTYELIDTLSCITTLFVIDRQTAREFKNTSLKSKEVAQELDVRYIVTGAVQKAGAHIRISATLVDTVNGATLWNFKQDGRMDDIFDIQEQVAKKIAQKLLLTLSPSEARKIEARATTVPEAYELYLQAMYYDNRNTKQDTLNAIRLGEAAVALDPTFALAIVCLAYTYLSYYRNYDRSERWLDQANAMLTNGIGLQPDSAHAQSILGFYYVYRGDADRAIAASKKGVELDPFNWLRWFQLGFIYMILSKHLEAAGAFEESLERNPESLPAHFNLAIMFDNVNDHVNKRRAALRGLPLVEKFVRRHPDDQTQRVSYAMMLLYAGRAEEAIEEAESLLQLPGIDSNTYYNTACLFLSQRKRDRALELFEKAIDTGFRNIDTFRSNADNELMREDINTLHRYLALIQRLEDTVLLEKNSTQVD